MSARGSYTAIAAAGCLAAAGAAGERNGPGAAVEESVIVRSTKADAGGNRPERASDRECRKRLYALIRTCPVSRAPLDSGSTILYQPYPLSGPCDRAVFDSIGTKVVAFLSGRGAVQTISVAKLDSCLSDLPGGCGGSRYLVTPLAAASISKKRSIEVEKFAKLDTAGSFVPSRTSSTLTSIETELRIRFVALDLETKTVAYSGRIVKKTSSAPALDREITGRTHKEKNGAGENGNAYRAAEKIIRKLTHAFKN